MLTCTETLNIRPYIEQAYSSDPVVVDQWHVTAGAGLQACINRTVADLEACKTLKFYTVHDGATFVGYFGTEFGGYYMPTIFVAREYRADKAAFWSEIEKRVTNPWKAGIYAKNTPCMKFYSKHGKQVDAVDAPDGTIAVFEFRRE